MPSPPYSAFRINCGPVPANATFEMDLSVLPWKDDFATDWSKTVEFTWFATIGLIHQFLATSNGKFLTLTLQRSTPPGINQTRLELKHPTSGFSPTHLVAINWRNLAAESFWYWQPILWQSFFYVYGFEPSVLAIDRFQGEIPITRTDT